MIKALVRRAFRAAGIEAQKLKSANTEGAILRNLLRHRPPAVVLDVGANIGQFAHGLREAGYRGRIVSFEALPDVHAELSRVASRDPQWTVAPCAALGSASGVAEMNVAGNVASSSLLSMLPAHASAAPESVYVRRDQVKIVRLDELAASILPPTGDVYLKIDTQGYEREVLAGATGLLPRVTAMQLELSLVPLYEGAPLFMEMIQLAERLGFELFNVAPGFRDDRIGRLLQMDGFFVRADRKAS